MPARSVCLVTLSLSEAGPGRFGGQVSVTDIYHTIPYHTIPYQSGTETEQLGYGHKALSVSGKARDVPYLCSKLPGHSLASVGCSETKW